MKAYFICLLFFETFIYYINTNLDYGIKIFLINKNFIFFLFIIRASNVVDETKNKPWRNLTLYEIGTAADILTKTYWLEISTQLLYNILYSIFNCVSIEYMEVTSYLKRGINNKV